MHRQSTPVNVHVQVKIGAKGGMKETVKTMYKTWKFHLTALPCAVNTDTDKYTADNKRVDIQTSH